MISQQLKDVIKQALISYPNLLGVYVLGSYFKGQVTKDSDFDLAVVVKKKTSQDEKEIYKLLYPISFPKNLDLSVVDKSSSPLFLFQIISTGGCLFAISEKDRVEFEAFVMQAYYDNAHIRNIYYSYLNNKFA